MYSSGTSDYKNQTRSVPTYDQPATGKPVGSESYQVPVNQRQIPLSPAQYGSTTQWSSGLFSCCDDVSNCCITCWCHCITFGQIAEITDKGGTSCATSGALYALINKVTGCCSCCYSCFYRTKIRQQFNLHESPCGDFLVHCFCEVCALCQEYRELKTRGYDMSIGWQGNVEREARGVAMAPVVQGGMTR